MKFDMRQVRDLKTKEIPIKDCEMGGWSDVYARSGNYEEPDGSIRKLTSKEISKINREDLLSTLF
ncbi:hypothetical protein HN615_11245 [Candidatus Woesearchaeota archaeon]|nr:hypothetical protein [Candidatus Woesearchaeota archaeon]